MIYLIGSLQNRYIPELARDLRATGREVFDDWQSAPSADLEWQDYERARGRTYQEAMAGAHARNVVGFDKAHLDRCSAGVLVLPAGKSGHLELGYLIGRGTPAFILLAGEPYRFDIMYGLATGIVASEDELIAALNQAGV